MTDRDAMIAEFTALIPLILLGGEDAWSFASDG
jgi:hypothetical protein